MPSSQLRAAPHKGQHSTGCQICSSGSQNVTFSPLLGRSRLGMSVLHLFTLRWPSAVTPTKEGDGNILAVSEVLGRF